MLTVMLLRSLKLDVPLLLNAAQQGLGRKLSSSLDSRGSDLKSQVSWLTILATLKSPDVKPEAVTQAPGALALHAFYTFLVIAPHATFGILIEDLRPPIIWTPTPSGLGLGVLSGTLDQIRTWIINCTGVVSDFTTRTFGNELMTILEAEGFGRLFSDYIKRVQPDKTYKLLERK